MPSEGQDTGEPQAVENTVMENQPEVVELKTLNVFGLSHIDKEGNITLAHSSRGRRAIYSSVGHAKAARKRFRNQGLRIVAFESIGVVEEK